MANGEEVKDSSERTVDSLIARESGASQPRVTGDDGPDRVGGDIETRGDDETDGNAQPGQGAGSQTGSTKSPPEHDPERGA